MSKPPNFVKCSICGREFGSKSIVIHEPQCLERLRQTEIKEAEEKKRSTPRYGKPKKNVSSAYHTFGETSIGTSFTLPRISNPQRFGIIRCLKFPNSHHFVSFRKLDRPTTATLDRPKVLNPEYKHYDMSIRRIDFTSLSLPEMDDNSRNCNFNFRANSSFQRGIIGTHNHHRRSLFPLPTRRLTPRPSTPGTESKIPVPTSLQHQRGYGEMDAYDKAKVSHSQYHHALLF